MGTNILTRDEIYHHVKLLTKTYVGKSVTLSWNSRLLEDLRIDGDDAYNLLTELAQDFNLDEKRIGIFLKNHFHSEVAVPFYLLASWLMPSIKSGKLSVTISDIVDLAEQGRELSKG